MKQSNIIVEDVYKDYTVEFELIVNNEVIFKTSDYFQIKKLLSDYPEKSIHVTIKHQDKKLKEYTINLKENEDFVYFKRNVINILSDHDTDELSDYYKIVCIGKLNCSHGYELIYYNLKTKEEIRTNNVNYF